MTREQLDRRLGRIKAALAALGPLHPGSLSEQYTVCGTPGCRCKDPRKPQRHGPYHHLSYSWRGRGSTRFVRPARVARVRRKLANYKRLRALVAAWVDTEMAIEELERHEARKAG